MTPTELPFLFQDNPHPMWVVDRRTWRFLAVNRQAVRRYGWSKKEFLRMSLYDIRTPAEAARLRRIGPAKVRHPSVWQHRTKHGRLLDVTINSAPIEYQGRPAMLALAQDVTARLQAERALRREKEALRDYLDAFAGIFVVLDPAGRVTLINRKGCETLGWPAGRVVGRDWFEHFIPERMRASMRRFYKEIQHGRAKFDVFENPVLTRRGEISVRWRNSALRGADGKISAVLCSGEDVTQQRRVEDALAQTRRRHEALFQHAHEGIAFLDRRSVLIDVNPAVCALLRLPRQRIVGRSFIQFTPARDRKRGRGMFADYLRTARSAGDYRLTRSDGQVVDIEYHAIGEILPGIGLVVLRDVTQERRSEQRLKLSEERYRRLVENWPEAIATHQDGRFVFANAAAVRLFGARQASDLVGRLSIEVVHPESRKAVRGRWKRLARGMKTPWMEQRVLRLDGTEAWVEISAVPTTHEGRPAVQVFARDISDRVASREALRQSEERYRTLVENWQEGILIHQDGRIVYANRAHLRTLGATSADQVIGTPVLDRVHPDSRAHIKRRMALLKAQQALPPVEQRLLRLDGTSAWCAVSVVVTTYRGKPAVQAFARDISEQVAAREALRESEERYRLLVENWPAAVLIHCEGRIVFANPSCVKMFGAAKASQVVGRAVMDLVHPDFRARVAKRVARLQHTGAAPTAEELLLRVDGTPVWAEIAAVATTFQGKPAIQVFGRDISEQVAAREALRDSEERYRTLVENWPEAIAAHQDGRFVFANAAALRLYGARSPSQMIGKGVLELALPEFRPLVEERLKTLAEGRPLPWMEQRIRRFDGTELWVESLSVPTTIEGRPAVQIFARNIGDRVAAREALRMSEERLRLLVEGVKDYAMFMLDADGRVAAWNEGARRLMGYEGSEVLGRPFATFFRDSQTPARIVRAAAEDGRADAEGWRRRRDGSWFWASGVLTSIRGSDGALRGFVKVLRDVTELRRLERETVEFSAREQRRLGQDLHDGLGQHLTGLSLLAQALAGKLHVEGPELAAQAERIAALAREAIDQTRALSHGLDPVEGGPDGLADALERLAASASSLLSVRCIFETGEDAKVPDHSQAVQLYRIAQEAVNNAVKHGRAAVVNIRLQVAAGTVTLTVTDDGVGLPARPRRAGGRGLHTMGYRARTMGGLLKVANGETGGAVVICTCPLQEAPVSAGSKA